MMLHDVIRPMKHTCRKLNAVYSLLVGGLRRFDSWHPNGVDDHNIYIYIVIIIHNNHNINNNDDNNNNSNNNNNI